MERKLILVVVLAAATWKHSTGDPINLLRNPSFEENVKRNWKGHNFKPERITWDKVDGTYSVKITGRQSKTSALMQDVDSLNGKGRHYAFEGYVKLLNAQSGRLWQPIKVVLSFNLVQEKEPKGYIIAYRGFATPEKGWMRVNGSIEGPMKEYSGGKLLIRGPEPEVDFLVDNLTLYEVPGNPKWREEANSNIEKHRKSNINFKVNVPSGVNEADLELEISLTKHLFAFGGKVTEHYYGLKPATKFEYYFNRFFNWGAVQSYKWKFGTSSKDRYYKDYSRATNVTDQMIANGKTVRGHTVLWGFEDNNPAWLEHVSDNELRPVITEHIHDVMNLAKNRTAQLDVQNEHVHGHYYEERLQDPDITKEAFKLAKQLAPDGPVLYLNDYTCITSGANTEDLFDLAMSYKAEGIPVEGLGCQGHTKDFVKPYPPAMWRRIDRLAMTGLDIMMTEFDIGWYNTTERALWLEDAIRGFYGHPYLKGVILWGFWNGSMQDIDHELVSGPDPNTLTLLETGKRFSCLVNNEWMTRETRKIAETGPRFTVRGFQGDYVVIVKNKGVAVQTKKFTLGKADTTVQIKITKNTNPIPVEPLKSLEENCPPKASHEEEQGPTGQPSTGIECRSAYSKSSGTDANVSVSVTCRPDETMSGCFSYHTALVKAIAM